MLLWGNQASLTNEEQLEALTNLLEIEIALEEAHETAEQPEAKASFTRLLGEVHAQVEEIASSLGDQCRAVIAQTERLRAESRAIREGSEALRVDSYCLREESRLLREETKKKRGEAKKSSSSEPPAE